MKYLRKFFYCFLFLLFLNSLVSAQYIYNFSSHNFLQYNAAYAGQDTNHCFFLGAELNSELLKSEENRWKGAPYSVQFSYAGNFKQLESGLGAIGSIYSVGNTTQYDVGFAYNFNFTINENANLRLGLNWHERIIEEKLQGLFNWNSNGSSLTSRTKKGSNLNSGLWFAMKKFQFGFSVNNIFKEEPDFNYLEVNKKVYFTPGINSIASYEFTVSESLKARPTVVLERLEKRFSTNLTCLLSGTIMLYNTYIVGSGYMLREFIPDGPLYLEAGVKAGRYVQAMLGYSGWVNAGSSAETVSAMIKVNLY